MILPKQCCIPAVRTVLVLSMLGLTLPLVDAQQGNTGSHAITGNFGVGRASDAKNLLQAATRTAVTVSPEMHAETYFWVSDQQVLFLRPNSPHRQFHAVLVDAQTGVKTLPIAFNAYASPRMPVVETGTVSYEETKQVIHLFSPPPNVLSADGKWLPWRAGYPVVYSWCAASLAGSQRREWKAAPSSSEYAFWLPDGRHWIELIRKSTDFVRLLIHDLSTNDKPQAVRLTGVGDDLFLGLKKGNILLVRHLNLSLPANKPSVHMTAIAFGRNAVQVQDFTVRLPRPAEVADVILSPAGDQLAWVLSDGTNGEVWLSNASGKEMHMLGQLDVDTAWHGSFHWLPNSKHLSFQYEGYVWRVAIR